MSPLPTSAVAATVRALTVARVGLALPAPAVRVLAVAAPAGLRGVVLTSAAGYGPLGRPVSGGAAAVAR